jgi:hypothetical protein
MTTGENKEQAMKSTIEDWFGNTGIKMDPATARVAWCFAQMKDPWGNRAFGTIHFARSPESDTWVCFDDLTWDTASALHDRIKRGECDAVRFDIVPPPFSEGVTFASS